MKTISSVTSWANGQATEAKLLNAYVIKQSLIIQVFNFVN